MKRINYGIFILMNVLLTLLLTNCKCHRDDSVAPDPCSGKSITGAKFNIFEDQAASNPSAGFHTWISYATDTVARGLSYVDFIALDTSALSYTWTIGAGTYTTKKVSLDFRGASGKTFLITLKIKKKTPNACFPSDTGTITFSKLMVVSDTSLVSGNFKGIKTDTLGNNPSDSFTVNINPKCPLVISPGDTVRTLVVSNLYPNCTTNTPYKDLVIGYKEILFGGFGNNCNNVGGRAMLSPTNNDIIISFAYFNYQTGKDEAYTFKGKRIK